MQSMSKKVFDPKKNLDQIKVRSQQVLFQIFKLKKIKVQKNFQK